MSLTGLTADHLRECLSGTRPPADPTDILLPPGSDRWPGDLRERLTGTLVPAGVLMPLREAPNGGLNLLFTERSAELRHHAGQVSFPGGRMESGDEDIVATALREANEEIGLALHEVNIMGVLRPMPTLTGYAITPVVGLVARGAQLRIDRSEVASTFEVPLAWLVDPANRQLRRRDVRGRRMRLVEFEFEGQRIWGATAFIILQFLEILYLTKSYE